MRKLLLFGMLVSSVAFAEVEVQDGKISADISGQPLRQVLQTLKQNTSITFSVDDEITGQTISASFKDLPVAAGIKKLLEGTGINYVVMADANGDPTSVFLGKSEKPGAPPKKLDTRPVTNMPNRGVVTPVVPQQSEQQRVNPAGKAVGRPGGNQNQNPNQNPPAGTGMGTTIEIPTAGSFVAPAPQIQPYVNPNTENRQDPGEDEPDEDEEDEE